MTPEVPLLRLGLAGFTPEQRRELEEVVDRATADNVCWTVTGGFMQADAWWLYGARTQQLDSGILRIAAGQPDGRSIQLNLADIDRPLAFALPYAPRGPVPAPYTFDPQSPEAMRRVLQAFERELQAMVAQFCLASNLLVQEASLQSTTCRVIGPGRRLLALVDMRGDVSVRPEATRHDFEAAIWSACPREELANRPPGFVTVSLALLMWRYATRTERDVLPVRYRTNVLYFRRSPRLPQRLLGDSHLLLLLRELALGPATFDALATATGLRKQQLARDLGALYLVGAITASAKRAASMPGGAAPDSIDAPSSVPNSVPPDGEPARPMVTRVDDRDMTVPAPLGFK